MAAAPQLLHIPAEIKQKLEFPGVFQGRELTRKTRRLSAGIPSVDELLGGGLPRGRISEIFGHRSSGAISLAASFMASATSASEVVGIVDVANRFDPLTMDRAGVELKRTLWVHPASMKNALRAAELIMEGGGFGLVVIDFADRARFVKESAALRLARWAERSGASVLVIGGKRICGTFSALSILLDKQQPLFAPGAGNGSWLFDGLQIEIYVTRNKLGACGGRAPLRVAIDQPKRSEFQHNQIAENFAIARAN